jgi:hypothetical protein
MTNSISLPTRRFGGDWSLPTVHAPVAIVKNRSHPATFRLMRLKAFATNKKNMK